MWPIFWWPILGRTNRKKEEGTALFFSLCLTIPFRTYVSIDWLCLGFVWLRFVQTSSCNAEKYTSASMFWFFFERYFDQFNGANHGRVELKVQVNTMLFCNHETDLQKSVEIILPRVICPLLMLTSACKHVILWWFIWQQITAKTTTTTNHIMSTWK